jgi:hypothetical protein
VTLLEAPEGDLHLVSRWLFLRILGLVFLSAFLSLVPQILGLVGSKGILPARDLVATARVELRPVPRLFEVPSLVLFADSDRALQALAYAGVVASALLVLNVVPRASLALATLLFLSFLAVAQDFASYQSDGMLMEAALASLFLAPPGLRPGLGRKDPPLPLARAFLLWEWFRIYFESGVAKLASGEPEWRHLTALDHYYEFGPLPTVVGYYVQKLPHAFHAATALLTLAFECVLVFLALGPRRVRLAVLALATALQIGIGITANYTFLNLLVLGLGVLLVEDRDLGFSPSPGEVRPKSRPFQVAAALVLGFQFCVTIVVFPFFPRGLLGSALLAPVRLAEPFRLVGRYGLFAVMTKRRDEIEFQGSRDGVSWTAYPFRFKPQDPRAAPGIYAPYHPRFDWNLWFASLGPWQQSPIVERTEERLLLGSADVLRLFARDPFSGDPPPFVRAVIASYRFTDLREKRETHLYWLRGEERLYAPVLERLPDGSVSVKEMPGAPEDGP